MSVIRMTQDEFEKMYPEAAAEMFEPRPKRKKAEVSPLETDEQKRFVRHARGINDPTFVSDVFFSSPNGMVVGGKNKFALMGKYKAEGFKDGVADILYLQARGIYLGLAIEMKRSNKRNEKDGGMSKDQIAFQNACRKLHWAAVTCYSADEAITVFDNYMKLKPLVAVGDDEVSDEMPSLA